MSDRLIVGLTGGIGSGKTLVSDTFATLGAHVIDTDVISRELTNHDSSTIKEI
ncbi:MAG: dephospho-CoA kinase, partial [Betaproteobacteria bacterium]